MSEVTEQKMDTNPAEIKEVNEAGLVFEGDTKTLRADNELRSTQMKEESKGPFTANQLGDSSVPLFMRDRESKKGNAQDEKDGTEE